MIIELRKLSIEDVEIMAVFANDKEVYDNTTSIPYPYTKEIAREGIEKNNFQQEGILKKEILKDGNFIDAYRYAKIKEE